MVGEPQFIADAPQNVKPWTQPLFMVYAYASDERVPLTQERLDQLLRIELTYRQMMSDIKRYHDDLVRVSGATPRPWEDPPK